MNNTTYKKIFFLYLALIYITLPFAGPFARYLRNKVFGISFMTKIAIFLILIFVVLFALYLLKGKGILNILLTLSIFLFIIFMTFKIKTPEEKLHLIEYFFLGFLAFKAFQNKNFFMIILLLVFLSALDEIIQYFLPTRYFDMKDIFSNLSGAVAGYVCSYINLKK